MDRVRFGRALGVGARAAAKTLISAAEAAAAPDPNPSAKRPVEPTRTAAQAAAPRPAAPRVVLPDTRHVAGHAKNLKRSVWSPLARYSSVLWLEVTGFFFSIFALILGNQAWKLRGAVRLAASSTETQHFYVYLALFALFAYFAVSSFLRARRRSQR